jgi:hypothetical protein
LTLRREEAEVWATSDELDEVLATIRAGTHAINTGSSRRDTFYLDHYLRELRRLEGQLKTTLLRKEIVIEHHHIESTRVLLSLFEEPQHSRFRATALLSDIGEEFDATYVFYFNEWLRLLKRKKVRRLQRLFLYDDITQFQRPLTQKLVAFHNSKVTGLEAKAVPIGEFRRFKADFHLDDGIDDIGIFSDVYIYMGHVRQGSNIAGHFSRDKTAIEGYTAMFDALWGSNTARPLTDFVAEAIAVEELFADPHIQRLISRDE